MFDSRRRRNPNRQLSFDALEGRMVMSAGVVHSLAAHPQAEMVHAEAQTIKGSFRGKGELSSGLLAFGGLTGKLGKVQFTGHGLTEVLGRQFEGGVLFLTNSEGTLTFDLRPATIKKAPGGAGALNSTMILEGATGAYSADNNAVVGSAGNFETVLPVIPNLPFHTVVLRMATIIYSPDPELVKFLLHPPPPG